MKWWSTNSQHLSLKHLLQNTFASLQHQFLSKGVFPVAGLMTVSELRSQLSDEHLQALNVMHCNKMLL